MDRYKCMGKPRKWRLVLPCSSIEYEILTCRDCGQAWITIKDMAGKERQVELQELDQIGI